MNVLRTGNRWLSLVIVSRKGGRLAKAAGITLAGIVGLYAAGANGGVINPGNVSDSNVKANWEYDLNAGAAELKITNLGLESRNEFDWKVADLLTLTAPGSWIYNYNPVTDLVRLTGSTLSNPESITIPFTFDPTNKELVYGNLDYHGDITSGTLQDIGVVQDIQAVAEPGTALLMGIAAAIAAARKKRTI